MSFNTNLLDDDSYQCLSDPKKYIHECKASGMSRAEVEAAIRGEVARSGLTPQFCGEQAWGTEPYNLMNRWRSLVREALLTAFGHRHPSPEYVVKALTGRHRADLDGVGPLFWFRQQGPLYEWDHSQPIKPSDGLNFAAMFEEFNPFAVNALNVHHARRIRPRDAAPMGGRQFPVCVTTCTYNLTDTSKTTFLERIFGSITGKVGDWYESRYRKPLDASNINDFKGLQDILSRVWYADITMGVCVRIVIGPHEAKELFALRDIPDGASRRAALLHIVSRHERHKRFSEADTVSVREHMRGAKDCVWEGCSVKIHAPPVGTPLPKLIWPQSNDAQTN